MTIRRVLVTGASGFIGRHLVDKLLASDMSVAVVARNAARLPASWSGRVECIEMTEWDDGSLLKGLESRQLDTIHHLAAYGVRPDDRDIDQMVRVNVGAPMALVRVGREHGASLLMAGSSAEYAEPEAHEPLTESSALEMTKLYGTSKAAGALMAAAMAKRLGVNLRILRLFSVYGPGEAAHRLLPNLIDGLSNRRRVALAPGTQVRDFLYVNDVVDAFVMADDFLRKQSTPSVGVWNVCSGVGHAVRDFACRVADVMDAGRAHLGFGDISMRPDEVPWLVGSPKRINAELGWHPQYDLEKGIRAVVASMIAKRRDAP